MKIKYKPVNILGIDLILATYKGVEILLAEFPNIVTIYSVQSKNNGKGYVQKALIKIREDYLPRKLFGSVPLNGKMQHIYEKLEINYAKP